MPDPLLARASAPNTVSLSGTRGQGAHRALPLAGAVQIADAGPSGRVGGAAEFAGHMRRLDNAAGEFDAGEARATVLSDAPGEQGAARASAASTVPPASAAMASEPTDAGEARHAASANAGHPLADVDATTTNGSSIASGVLPSALSDVGAGVAPGETRASADTVRQASVDGEVPPGRSDSGASDESIPVDTVIIDASERPGGAVGSIEALAPGDAHLRAADVPKGARARTAQAVRDGDARGSRSSGDFGRAEPPVAPAPTAVGPSGADGPVPLAERAPRESVAPERQQAEASARSSAAVGEARATAANARLAADDAHAGPVMNSSGHGRDADTPLNAPGATRAGGTAAFPGGAPTGAAAAGSHGDAPDGSPANLTARVANDSRGGAPASRTSVSAAPTALDGDAVLATSSAGVDSDVHPPGAARPRAMPLMPAAAHASQGATPPVGVTVTDLTSGAPTVQRGTSDPSSSSAALPLGDVVQAPTVAAKLVRERRMQSMREASGETERVAGQSAVERLVGAMRGEGLVSAARRDSETVATAVTSGSVPATATTAVGQPLGVTTGWRLDGGAPMPLSVAPHNVPLDQGGKADQLASSVRWTLGEGRGQALVNVTPAGLGPVSIRVSLERDQMNVSILAVQPGAREALESLVPRLREQLVADGHERVNVDVSDGREGQTRAGAHGHDAGERSGTGRATAGEEDARDVESLARHDAGSHDGRGGAMLSRSLIDAWV